MTAVLRSITLFTAMALLLFVGLHAVVPHAHPHTEGTHFSEIPPVAHAENKIFVLVLFLAVIPFVIDLFSYLTMRIALVLTIFYARKRFTVGLVPIRYSEALRKGRIHSRAD